jgi:hypothetical protein
VVCCPAAEVSGDCVRRPEAEVLQATRYHHLRDAASAGRSQPSRSDGRVDVLGVEFPEQLVGREVEHRLYSPFLHKPFHSRSASAGGVEGNNSAARRR